LPPHGMGRRNGMKRSGESIDLKTCSSRPSVGLRGEFLIGPAYLGHWSDLTDPAMVHPNAIITQFRQSDKVVADGDNELCLVHHPAQPPPRLLLKRHIADA